MIWIGMGIGIFVGVALSYVVINFCQAAGMGERLAELRYRLDYVLESPPDRPK